MPDQMRAGHGHRLSHHGLNKDSTKSSIAPTMYLNETSRRGSPRGCFNTRKLNITEQARGRRTNSFFKNRPSACTAMAAGSQPSNLTLISRFKRERIDQVRQFNLIPDWSDIYTLREKAMATALQSKALDQPSPSVSQYTTLQ